MVGNRIGAGKKEEAYETVRRVIILSVSAAWLVGLGVFLSRDVVIGMYELSPSGVFNTRMLMLMMACTLWIRMFNFSTFIGALRAGGDTRFALIMEICSIWLIGVPAAYIGAFVLRLPVYLVYLMVILEEVAKVFVSGWRFRSRKWIHDLVNVEAAP
jgi:Na+-driven multidrug efflux pump